MTDKKSSSVEEFLRLLHKYLNNLESTEKFDVSRHSVVVCRKTQIFDGMVFQKLN